MDGCMHAVARAQYIGRDALDAAEVELLDVAAIRSDEAQELVAVASFREMQRERLESSEGACKSR